MPDMERQPESDEGWGFPEAARVSHYFINNMDPLGKVSLCKQWVYSGEIGTPYVGEPCQRCLRSYQALWRRRARNLPVGPHNNWRPS